MAFCVGIAAEQTEEVRAERAPRGPRLLPVEHPSPAAIFGRMRACCSEVPNSKIVGASRKMPFCVTRGGAPAR